MGKPWRAGDAPFVYVLERIRDGVKEIAGVFSTGQKAQAEVVRVVASEVGEKVNKLPGWRSGGDGTLQFAYGRDQHDFRFLVTPWPVDAEAS